jgi:hypothetical protein
MRPIWPALFSAFVGPGAGQIINGDFKKGFLLLGTTLISFLWFSKVVGERLMMVLSGTPDQWKMEPSQLKDAITGLIHESPAMFVLFHLLMFLLWTFSVVDAYLVARELQRGGGRPVGGPL